MILAAIGAASLYCLTASAHTESEYLYKARDMIGTLLSSGWDSEEEMLEHQQSDDPLYHWNYTSQNDFFEFFVTNGWPRSECEVAFDKYLGWISTNDMTAVDSQDRMFARSALGQCEAMKYAKALETIRAYAMNTTAIDRVSVIDTAVRFGGVDDASASFMDTIVTNKARFSYHDISWAIPSYCNKLCSVNTNDAEAVAIRARGARLFYANRLEWPDASALDDVFVAAFPGYDFSSNRLDYANHVLSWTTNNDWRAMRDHFVAITNQLHSLGLPLVELNLDESSPNHE